MTRGGADKTPKSTSLGIEEPQRIMGKGERQETGRGECQIHSKFVDLSLRLRK